MSPTITVGPVFVMVTPNKVKLSKRGLNVTLNVTELLLEDEEEEEEEVVVYLTLTSISRTGSKNRSTRSVL